MRDLVQQAIRRPEVIQAAHDIVRDLPSRDTTAEIASVFEWVRDHLRYTNDPVGPDDSVELLKAPWAQLEEIAEWGRVVGDCDDAVLLLAALLSAAGRPVRFVVGRVDRRRPLEPSHVWLEAWDGDRWVALDPIMPGWSPGDHVDPRDLQGRPRYLQAGEQMSGLGFAPGGLALATATQAQTTSNQSGATSGGGTSFWDQAGGFVKTLTPAAQSYFQAKYGGSSPPTFVSAPMPTPARAAPGFFQRIDPATGRAVTNWGAVALVGGGVALVGLLVAGGARGRRRR